MWWLYKEILTELTSLTWLSRKRGLVGDKAVRNVVFRRLWNCSLQLRGIMAQWVRDRFARSSLSPTAFLCLMKHQSVWSHEGPVRETALLAWSFLLLWSSHSRGQYLPGEVTLQGGIRQSLLRAEQKSLCGVLMPVPPGGITLHMEPFRACFCICQWG